MYVPLNTSPVLQLQYVTLISKSDQSYMLMSNIIFYNYLYHTVSVGKITRQITCIKYSLTCAVVTIAYAPDSGLNESINKCNLHTISFGNFKLYYLFNNFCKKHKYHFLPLHNHLHIIRNMITYNLGKPMNHIMWIITRFSIWGLRFYSDC